MKFQAFRICLITLLTINFCQLFSINQIEEPLGMVAKKNEIQKPSIYFDESADIHSLNQENKDKNLDHLDFSSTDVDFDNSEPLDFKVTARRDESKSDIKHKESGYKNKHKAKYKESKHNKTQSGYEISNSWGPYMLNKRYLQKKYSPFFQMNVGPGFLYFDGVRGNIASGTDDQSVHKTREKMQGKLTYNRALVTEAVLGLRLTNWIKLAMSGQHQGGIVIQTLPQKVNETVDANHDHSYLVADVTFDSLAAKVYFSPPYFMIWKKMSLAFYVAPACGASWQTWNHMSISYMALDSEDDIGGFLAPLRMKVFANVFVMVDAGFKLQSVVPETNFSVLFGCKYNQWGQTRQLGKLQNQGHMAKYGLGSPVSIKLIYSFVPYIGVQWNF